MLPLPVGTVLGAITGGLIGLATETGVLRGTGVGGITGALVSMEVVESLWRSDEPAIWSVVYVVGGACWLSFRRPGRPVLISFLGLVVFFLLARCHLELAHRPPCAREGGPRRAQRRREPGASARATQSRSHLKPYSLPWRHALVGSCR